MVPPTVVGWTLSCLLPQLMVVLSNPGVADLANVDTLATPLYAGFHAAGEDFLPKSGNEWVLLAVCVLRESFAFFIPSRLNFRITYWESAVRGMGSVGWNNFWNLFFISNLNFILFAEFGQRSPYWTPDRAQWPRNSAARFAGIQKKVIGYLGLRQAVFAYNKSDTNYTFT